MKFEPFTGPLPTIFLVIQIYPFLKHSLTHNIIYSIQYSLINIFVLHICDYSIQFIPPPSIRHKVFRERGQVILFAWLVCVIYIICTIDNKYLYIVLPQRLAHREKNKIKLSEATMNKSLLHYQIIGLRPRCITNYNVHSTREHTHNIDRYLFAISKSTIYIHSIL